MISWRWPAILLILMLGGLSRSLHIADQSFWVDEGYAFYHAHFPDLVASLARDTHPPLYFAALRLWSELAGQSELALRWFSLLPSMLSLAVVYQFARELCWHRSPADPQRMNTVPMLALLMLALADAENFLAQEARHYTWLVLLVLCSMWFFLRWLRRGNRRAYLAWIAFTIVMVYTHYITAFAGIAQGIYALLWLRGKARLRAFIGLVASALALMPWLLLAGRQQLNNSGANWSVDLTPAVARDILVKYFTQQWPLVIALMLLGCFTVIALSGRRFQLRMNRVTWLLLLWLIAPLLLTLLANEFLPFLQPRRLTQWTPAIAILLACGLVNFRQPGRAVLILVLLLYGALHVDFYRVKPNWRGIAAMTARYAVPGDLVLTDIAGGDYQMGYYLRRAMPDGPLLDPDARYESLKIQRDFYADSYESWLPQLLDGYDTVWLMRWSDDRSAFDWLDELGFQESADYVHWHDGGASGQIDLHIYRFDRLHNTEPFAIFSNGMSLHSATFDLEDLRADLLWRARMRLERDYVVSVKLIDADGVVVAQHDGSPQNDLRPSSGWLIDELIFSPHELEVEAPLSAGDYQLIAQVYRLESDMPVNVLTVHNEEWAVLETVRIDAAD